jgi:hypothetical protein
LKASEARKVDKLTNDADALESAVGRLRAIETEMRRVPRRPEYEGNRSYGSLGRVTRGDLTYRPGRPYSYFADLVARQLQGSADAAARLAQHGQEMEAERPQMVADGRRIP